MNIYDTLRREKVHLDLDRKRVVRMFVCGPTVQDRIHLGHARVYVFFDVLARYLRMCGFDLFYLQNITDVDDRIIKKSLEKNTTYSQIAAEYLRLYMETIERLGIESVNFYARATLFMDEIIGQVDRLVKSGYAYPAEDGVYFRLSSFPDFGKLSGQYSGALVSGARVAVNENKEDSRDFVLWKRSREGEPSWGSPYGEGRPGWHIEDTAITESFFGPCYDIHGGGADLMFPHHDAEIAIERSLSGKEYLSKYWIHVGMVNVRNEKMSKSTGNFVSVSDLLDHYTAATIRLALLSSNYRNPIDFSDEMMEEAAVNSRKFNTLYMKLKKLNSVTGKWEMDGKWTERMRERLDDDMDTRGAIGILNEFSSLINSHIDDISGKMRDDALSVLEWSGKVFGIMEGITDGGSEDILVEEMIDLRNRMRRKRDFESADSIRLKLRESGVYIEDRGDETIWWRE